MFGINFTILKAKFCIFVNSLITIACIVNLAMEEQNEYSWVYCIILIITISSTFYFTLEIAKEKTKEMIKTTKSFMPFLILSFVTGFIIAHGTNFVRRGILICVCGWCGLISSSLLIAFFKTYGRVLSGLP